LLKLSVQYGYYDLPVRWGGRHDNRDHDVGRYATAFNPAVFSLALNSLLQKEGVEFRYDMIASYPVMEGRTCNGLITESKSGREFFPAKMIIDATEDADIIFRAGMPCRTGENYLTYIGHGCTREDVEKALNEADMIALNSWSFSVGSSLDGVGHPPGMPMFQGIDNELVSRYIQTGQEMLFQKITAHKKDGQFLYALPGMPQLRKTRCLIGSSCFISENGAKSEDSIGAVGDFRYPGICYEIPAGVLFHPDYPNIIAAGRIVSADGDGWEITRVIPTAALTGQAAGVYAKLAVEGSLGASEISVREVQRILKNDSVRLHV